MTRSDSFQARLSFHGDLLFFLGGLSVSRWRGAGVAAETDWAFKESRSANAPMSAETRTIERTLFVPTSVKDAIEACGIPHPEVDVIAVNQTPADFSFVLRKNSVIDVYPVSVTPAISGQLHLQRRGIARFVADGHLGKLARNLRLLGFDVAYSNQADDRDLLNIMQREQRALLTRDRRLLMHAIVEDGYCPRSDDPARQTVEVVRRFGLEANVQPFTRCLGCNALLQDVAKSEVLDQLEPLTRIYYDHFRRCPGCGKIYWRGSHFSKLKKSLQQFGAPSAR